MLMSLSLIGSLLAVSALIPPRSVSPFLVPTTSNPSRSDVIMMRATASPSYLLSPTERDAHYGPNVARYLVDLHDSKTTFNFCGGMMFQLMLSDKLRHHLGEVAATQGRHEQQPVIFDDSHPRMFQIPEYSQSSRADNVHVFHGREIRKVPKAEGGMGFVLQLSHSEDDPQGWTKAEVDGYDGWGHDSGRVWRTGDRLEEEGLSGFRDLFGPEAFALHHRFYLHRDSSNRMWLSAEDGCEGTPSAGGGVANRIAALMGLAG